MVSREQIRSKMEYTSQSTDLVNETVADVIEKLGANSTSASDSERDEHLAMIEISTLSVILFLAVVSNVTILFVIWRQRKNRPLSRMYYFMLHLSLADLLVAVFNILPQLAWDITFRFKGGDILCRFVKYTQVMTLYLSTYILMFMAVDRYRAVCSNTNLHWNSLKVCRGMIIASWVMALVLALPQAIIFREQIVAPGVYDCWVSFIEPWGAKAYVTWFVISIFGAPLFVIVICYSVISREIWIYSKRAVPVIHSPPSTPLDTTSKIPLMRRWWTRSRTRSRTSSSVATNEVNDSTHANHNHNCKTQNAANRSPHLRRSNSNRISKAKMKTIKLTLVVVVCFVACWAPFCITQLILAFYPPDNMADISPVAVIFLLLASLNSCTNPWVYLAFSGSLLNQMRLCIGLRWRRNNDNDSIGEDVPDRRARVQGAPMRIINHRGSARTQRPSPPQPPAIRCSRADVITHLRTPKSDEPKDELFDEV